MNPHGWVFAFDRPDGRVGVVNDPDRRLIVALTENVARAFMKVLADRAGLDITAVKRNPVEMAELVMSAHVAPDDVAAHIIVIEDGTTDASDALFRAAEMANAVPLDTAGDWTAAHAHDEERAR